MKRWPSDLVLFTLVKVFEQNVRWAIFYHFFGPVKLFYEKGTDVGRLVVVIDVNPSHGFWTTRLMKLFGHEGK
jgi:hypothetical protein